MITNVEDATHPRIYTTPDGQVVIEQSADSRVLLSPEQILKVIKELHACYDYCAAWKESAP